MEAVPRGMFTSAAGVMARPPDTEHPQQPAPGMPADFWDYHRLPLNTTGHSQPAPQPDPPGMERIWDDGGIRRYRKRAVTEPPGARPARETIVSTTTGVDERSCTHGHVNSDGAKFCSACAEPLRSAAEQRQAEDRTLAGRGQLMPEDLQADRFRRQQAKPHQEQTLAGVRAGEDAEPAAEPPRPKRTAKLTGRGARPCRDPPQPSAGGTGGPGHRRVGSGQRWQDRGAGPPPGGHRRPDRVLPRARRARRIVQGRRHPVGVRGSRAQRCQERPGSPATGTRR